MRRLPLQGPVSAGGAGQFGFLRCSRRLERRSRRPTPDPKRLASASGAPWKHTSSRNLPGTARSPESASTSVSFFCSRANSVAQSLVAAAARIPVASIRQWPLPKSLRVPGRSVNGIPILTKAGRELSRSRTYAGRIAIAASAATWPITVNPMATSTPGTRSSHRSGTPWLRVFMSETTHLTVVLARFNPNQTINSTSL